MIVWLALVGFNWLWLALVGFNWLWLALVGFVPSSSNDCFTEVPLIPLLVAKYLSSVCCTALL